MAPGPSPPNPGVSAAGELYRGTLSPGPSGRGQRPLHPACQQPITVDLPDRQEGNGSEAGMPCFGTVSFLRLYVSGFAGVRGAARPPAGAGQRPACVLSDNLAQRVFQNALGAGIAELGDEVADDAGADHGFKGEPRAVLERGDGG